MGLALYSAFPSQGIFPSVYRQNRTAIKYKKDRSIEPGLTNRSAGAKFFYIAVKTGSDGLLSVGSFPLSGPDLCFLMEMDDDDTQKANARASETFRCGIR